MHATLPGPSCVLLEPLEVGDTELGDDVGVLTERARLPGPPWLGREVQRRVERCADADRAVLLAGDVGEPAHRRRVAQGSQAERLGPLREGARGEGDTGVLHEGVARVRGDRDRYAVWRLFREGLERVVPASGHARVVERVDVEVGQVLLEHDDRRRRLADHARVLEDRAVRAGLDHGLEHQAGLLRQREP